MSGTQCHSVSASTRSLKPQAPTNRDLDKECANDELVVPQRHGIASASGEPLVLRDRGVLNLSLEDPSAPHY